MIGSMISNIISEKLLEYNFHEWVSYIINIFWNLKNL